MKPDNNLPDFHKKDYSRRDFLRLTAATAVSTLIPFPSKKDESIVPTTAAYIHEFANIPDSLEQLTGYESTLGLLYDYFQQENAPQGKAKIGWIDTSPINPEHGAFAGMINSDLSRSFANNKFPNGEGNYVYAAEVSSHANMALQFATQIGSGGTAGFCQARWSEILFANLYTNGGYNPDNDSTIRCANAIKYLVDSGAGVIGMIPTWRASQITNPNKLYNAIFYAASKNVPIIVAGGNANTDLGHAADKRIPHERAQSYTNCLLIGGVDETGARAEWGSEQGSNYGINPKSETPYMTFLAQATNRLVPAAGQHNFIVYNGTTCSTGEFTAAFGILQHILGRDKQGNLPNIKEVLMYFTETTNQKMNPALSQYGLPRYDWAFKAAISNRNF